MKKILSIALVLVLVLSLGATAFAANGQEYDASLETNTITITKTLKATGTGARYPGDTLTFTAGAGTVTECTEGTEAPALPAIDPVPVVEGATSAAITVKLPKFDTVGVYTYTITENDTNVAGVTYRTAAITLVLTVIEKADGQKVIAAVHCETPVDPKTTEGTGSTKTDTFENTYKANALTIEKSVTGNLGDKQKEWNFTVTFTAPSGDTVKGTIGCSDETKAIAPGEEGWTTKTATFTLKDSESITFNNIPYGTKYTIAEAEANKDGYTTSGLVDTAKELKEDTTETIVNNKDMTPDTGISLDSLPYILIVAVVLAASVVMIVNKRRSEV